MSAPFAPLAKRRQKDAWRSERHKQWVRPRSLGYFSQLFIASCTWPRALFELLAGALQARKLSFKREHIFVDCAVSRALDLSGLLERKSNAFLLV